MRRRRHQISTASRDREVPSELTAGSVTSASHASSACFRPVRSDSASQRVSRSASATAVGPELSAREPARRRYLVPAAVGSVQYLVVPCLVATPLQQALFNRERGALQRGVRELEVGLRRARALRRAAARRATHTTLVSVCRERGSLRSLVRVQPMRSSAAFRCRARMDRRAPVTYVQRPPMLMTRLSTHARLLTLYTSVCTQTMRL